MRELHSGQEVSLVSRAPAKQGLRPGRPQQSRVAGHQGRGGHLRQLQLQGGGEVRAGQTLAYQETGTECSTSSG